MNKRWVVIAALVAAGIITWGSVRDGHAPFPYQFTGTAMIYSVLLVLADAAPQVAVPLAIATTFGLGYATVQRKAAAPAPSSGGVTT